MAIFIVQKILLDETGLNYICHTYERFYAVGTVLSNMVAQVRGIVASLFTLLIVFSVGRQPGRASLEACC